MSKFVSRAAAAVLLAMPLMAAAQGAPASLPLLVGQGAGGTSYSVPIQTLLFFTALSFLPAILLLMTGFTRIVIVLSLLRQALGTQSAPPNQVVIGLSLFLTMFVMGPTLDKVYQDAYLPYTQNSISFEQAMEKAEAPMRGFMLKQTRQSDFALFKRLAKLDANVTAETAPLRVLVPALPDSAALATARESLRLAVTELQFHDMSSQLIAHMAHTLQACAFRLGAAAMGRDEDEAESAISLPNLPEKPNPVTQSEMDAGSVELF